MRSIGGILMNDGTKIKKKYAHYAWRIGLAAAVLFGGCEMESRTPAQEQRNNEEASAVSAAPAAAARTSNETAVAPQTGIDLSGYALDTKETTRSVGKDRIRWTNADVTVTAKLFKHTDQAEVLTADFESLSIEAPSLPQPVKLQQSPGTVQGVTISPDRTYAAVTIGYPESTKLFIVNLVSEESEFLNDRLQKDGYGYAEAIHGAAWAPYRSGHDDHVLALGYGLIGETKAGLYHLDNARLLEVPFAESGTFFAAANCLWSRDGQTFDFFGETFNKAGQAGFTLLRYDTATGKTQTVREVERAELANLYQKLQGPTTFNSGG